MGLATRLDDDLSFSDMQLPSSLPPNSAVPLQPHRDATDLADRCAAFFEERPGGPFEIWSMWPTPDLSSLGFEPFAPPLMNREPGGEPPRAPSELVVREVDDEVSARDASLLIDAVFEARSPEPDSFLPLSVLGDDFRVWIGYVDDVPVSTATAYIDAGFVGLYAVATAAEARGSGYGEALAWVATLARPDLPATLQASESGRAVYERMGYRVVTNMSCWERSRERGGT